MALTLPRNIQLQLEQTLAQWSQWYCSPRLQRAPNAVRVLTPGVSNFSVLVTAGQQFVVRIDGVSPAAHGLNRAAEWRTLEAAHAAGLAPCPRYFNPALGSLVCDYLEPDKPQTHAMPAVAQLLRGIHQLPARHHRLDLGERILRYQKQLEHRGRSLPQALHDCPAAVAELLYILREQPGATVLCHGDLLANNRLSSGGRLWALDWEYCAMASFWYDLAVVVHGDALSVAETTVLLHNYLGREPDAKELDMLHQYGCIYRYLELLWYMALDQPVLTPTEFETKSAALLAMLAQRSR